jgi:hypothetical protein
MYNISRRTYVSISVQATKQTSTLPTDEHRRGDFMLKLYRRKQYFFTFTHFIDIAEGRHYLYSTIKFL